MEEAHKANAKAIRGLERQLSEISDSLSRARAEQEEAEARGELSMGKKQRDTYSALKAEACQRNSPGAN